jgi:hypothetical protein
MDDKSAPRRKIGLARCRVMPVHDLDDNMGVCQQTSIAIGIDCAVNATSPTTLN